MAPLYRVIDAGLATATELRGGVLRREDVNAMNEWIDAQEEAEEEARDRATKK